MNISKNLIFQEFAQKNKHFLWWVPEIKDVDESGIVEATLTYGNMEDKKELLSIMGKRKFKQHFDTITHGRRRQNLEPRTISYWTIYLSKE